VEEDAASGRGADPYAELAQGLLAEKGLHAVETALLVERVALPEISGADRVSPVLGIVDPFVAHETDEVDLDGDLLAPCVAQLTVAVTPALS